MTIKEDISDIKRHISVLNEEMGNCQRDIAVIRTNQKWLMKGWWGLIVPIIIQIIITVLNIPKP